MSHQSMLDLVTVANPVPDVESLPEGTIDVRTLRNYVAASPSLDSSEVVPSDAAPSGVAGMRPRRGIWLAAAVFAAVLAIGLGFLALGSGGDTEVVDPPTVTTAVPVTTFAPSTTTVVDEEAPVEPASLALIGDFIDRLDDGDAAGADALVATGVGGDLVARIGTAELFLDRYDLDNCLGFGDSIRCGVEYSDFFTNQLDLEPWLQQWELEIDQGVISRIDVSGDYPDLVRAMNDFETFVGERDPAAPVLYASEGTWVRSSTTIETARLHLAEFTALRSGIPAEAWVTIAAYFETLSTGDLDAFEALLTPDASFDERSGPNGARTVAYTRAEPQFMGHFWFEYVGLRTDTAPLKCTGDATAVSCRARNTGVLQLDTGGFEDGLLLFRLEGSLISAVSDKFNLPNLGNLYDTWIFDNGPDMTNQWSGRSTDIPETPEVARLLLEWYPRYVADTGVEVPPEYLDGSLLDD